MYSDRVQVPKTLVISLIRRLQDEVDAKPEGCLPYTECLIEKLRYYGRK